MNRKVDISSHTAGQGYFWGAVVCIITAAFLAPPAQAELTILNGSYQVQTYAQYQQTSAGGRAKYIEVDNSGNTYVTHDASNLMQIAANGDVSVLASAFHNLQGVEYTGGTSYGNFVYSAEVNTESIKKVSASGDVTTFASLPDQPLVLALDRTGNYGSQLYAATRYSTKIYSINESGSVSLFTNLSGITDGFPLDIAIDPTGRYNGSMYLSLTEVTNTNYQGILSVDSQGNLTQFRAGSYWGSHLAFDTTPGADFGGDLFIGGAGGINQITPEGEKISLLQSDRFIRDYAFGSDGALYVMEVESSTTTGGYVTISRVTVIPEPASLLLLSLGTVPALLRHRKNNA